jgi:hypothetical protein
MLSIEALFETEFDLCADMLRNQKMRGLERQQRWGPVPNTTVQLQQATLQASLAHRERLQQTEGL